MTSDPGWQRPEDSGVRPATARLVDPEDDLAANYHATGYSGDSETTRITYSDPGPPVSQAGPPSTAYGLIGDPEPLPYAAPYESAPVAVPPAPVAPTEIAPSDAEVKAAGRRGTQDLGLLLLRVALGLVFIAHGLQNAFGWFGGPGLDGFKAALAEAGYQNAGVLTYVGAGVQIAAGVLLVLGLFTPLAAAAALAFGVNSLLVAFEAQRQDGGLFVFGSSAEYLLVLAVMAAAVILAGPGRYGFDGTRGWARRPFIGSLLALVLGLAGGVAAWFLLHGTNPFA
ncbi:MAG: DoxX family protein [Mycobacterium sp.]|nr:DoxX family protein [Mycobacterium sp.]